MEAEPNLPQGDPLSPILFCLMLNDYKGRHFDIDFSNFADDCTLEMNTPMIKCNLSNDMKIDLRKKLQEEMDHFYQYNLKN